jgi:hypothetical protein
MKMFYFISIILILLYISNAKQKTMSLKSFILLLPILLFLGINTSFAAFPTQPAPATVQVEAQNASLMPKPTTTTRVQKGTKDKLNSLSFIAGAASFILLLTGLVFMAVGSAGVAGLATAAIIVGAVGTLLGVLSYDKWAKGKYGNRDSWTGIIIGLLGIALGFVLLAAA